MANCCSVVMIESISCPAIWPLDSSLQSLINWTTKGEGTTEQKEEGCSRNPWPPGLILSIPYVPLLLRLGSACRDHLSGQEYGAGKTRMGWKAGVYSHLRKVGWYTEIKNKADLCPIYDFSFVLIILIFK